MYSFTLIRTGTEATHRQYSEGCLLPHVPSFPCNSHRHPSCVIAELLRGRSREQVTSGSLASMSGNSLRPPRALLCFSRPLNVKRCLPEAPASNDVYLTRHQAWITCQNLPRFLCGVKGHTWNYCAEEGEPGDEAIYVGRCTYLNVST